METSIICSICNAPLKEGEKPYNVLQVGLAKFISYSKLIEDNFWKSWENKDKVSLHQGCGKRYAALCSKGPPKKKKKHDIVDKTIAPESVSEDNFSRVSEVYQEDVDCGSSRMITPEFESERTLSDDLETQVQVSRNSHSVAFDFERNCFLCGSSLDKYRKVVIRLAQKQSKDRLQNACINRQDEIAKTVSMRLNNVDIHKTKVQYHKTCYNNFMYSREDAPVHEDSHHETNEDSWFEMLCEYIITSGRFEFSLSDFENKLGPMPFSSKTIFKKLKRKFSNDIYISQKVGRSPMIYYKTFNLEQICSKFLIDNTSLDELEKKTILTVAARILRNDLKNDIHENDTYPDSSKFLDGVVSDIPNNLTLFLDELLINKNPDKSPDEDGYIKRDTIAHAIVTYLHPRSFISSLQIAVGTYIYRKTGSKLIINLLSKMGVCASYYTLQLYEASTIMDPPKVKADGAFIQFAFDNTDHNVQTLDGHETFHCLGGIAIHTPSYEVEFEGGSKKLKTMPSAHELANQNKISMVPLGKFTGNGLHNIELKPLHKLGIKNLSVISTSNTAYLLSKFLKISVVPSWKGFYEIVSRDLTFFPSNIRCLPFINEEPSKITTLNTSLHYAVSLTTNQKTTFVGYDQPLYIKARSIVAEGNPLLKNVVVRLGGFHLCMSFLGAVGFIMDGSGLEDLWSTVYAGESIKKMQKGQAFSRSLRAHILTYTSLGMLICSHLNLSQEVARGIYEFFENWKNEPCLIGDFDAENCLQITRNKFIDTLKSLEALDATAKLWIQYFMCINIVLQFIESERLGNFKLHLESMKAMIPIFITAGHFAYAKSTYIQIQDLAELEISMDDDEFRRFTTEGYFTIRKSDKPSCGISPDMCIEQTLNRFFGTDLRHGRGVTPSVVARYLQGMPCAFNVMECLEEYTGIQSINSEQHVDLSASRIARDNADIDKFCYWFKLHNPFQENRGLMSLSTGVIGNPDIIDCHLAFEKGQKWLLMMQNQTVDKISFSTKYKIKPLSAALTLNHKDDEFIKIDSALLFQRISATLREDKQDIRKALSYELSPIPLSLFDEQGFMRKYDATKLFEIFETSVFSLDFLNSFTYIVDGSWLLYRVVWPHSVTFKEIFDSYIIFIKANFGVNATVIFKGYGSEIIGVRSYSRYRKKEKGVAPDVEIDLNKVIPCTQKKFLSNVANKYKFVQLLVDYLKTQSIKAEIAEDPEYVIVQNAKSLTNEHFPVAIAGNNVDIFILLIALTPINRTIYFRKFATGKTKDVLYDTTHNSNLQSFILFAHAYLGCDTTSSIFNKGKKTLINILKDDPKLCESISIFYEPNQPIDKLYKTSEIVILRLYGNENSKINTVNDLRYEIFMALAFSAKKQISLAVLPPTDSSLVEHTKRVYYQIQRWLGNTSLFPDDWGWKRTNLLMLPIMSTKPPAPQELLRKIFCGCKGNCSSNSCSCKKSGVECTSNCKLCNGQSCNNSSMKSLFDKEVRECNEDSCEVDDYNVE